MLRLRNRKGIGIVMAISVAFFTLAIGVIVSMLVTNSAFAARRQREITRSYYLALAGIEAGSAVALKRGLDDSFVILEHFQNFTGSFDNEVFYQRIIFGPDAPPSPPGSNPHFIIEMDGDEIDFNGSEIEIWIYATYQDGTRITGNAATGTIWVEVLAIGWYYNYNDWQDIQANPALRHNTGMAHAGRIRFNSTEPSWFIREIVSIHNLPNLP